jgi:hypothetical protein
MNVINDNHPILCFLKSHYIHPTWIGIKIHLICILFMNGWKIHPTFVFFETSIIVLTQFHVWTLCLSRKFISKKKKTLKIIFSHKNFPHLNLYHLKKKKIKKKLCAKYHFVYT